MMTVSVEQDHRGLYRAGGLSAIVIGVAYIVTIGLFARVGAPPSDGEAWLRYLDGKTSFWWAILALSVITDLLFVPVAFSLYFALRGVNRDAMLVATALVAIFIILDLAVTWANHGALIRLSGHYDAATSEAQRAAYVAAANYAAAVLASPLEAVYAIMVLSLGIGLTSLLMLRGVFSRWTSYLGLAIGVSGIVSVAGWAVTVILNAVLATIWVIAVGFALYRLGQRGGRGPW